jgi:hypothetical protein
MAKFKNKVELRLVRSLSDFRAMRREAKRQADRLALDELCRRQAELLEWAMDHLPDGRGAGQDGDAP